MLSQQFLQRLRISIPQPKVVWHLNAGPIKRYMNELDIDLYPEVQQVILQCLLQLKAVINEVLLHWQISVATRQELQAESGRSSETSQLIQLEPDMSLTANFTMIYANIMERQSRHAGSTPASRCRAWYRHQDTNSINEKGNDNPINPRGLSGHSDFFRSQTNRGTCRTRYSSTSYRLMGLVHKPGVRLAQRELDGWDIFHRFHSRRRLTRKHFRGVDLAVWTMPCYREQLMMLEQDIGRVRGLSRRHLA